jgi:RNA polymerase sigma-70 factor (ECF subfamily)
METSVLAVKAALVRGRQTLRENHASDPWAAVPTEDVRSELDNLNRYASLFNAQNWDGLRAILANEVQLDLVSRASRRGPLKQYLTNYAELPPLRAVVGFLEGRPALAVHDPASSPTPKYFILLEWAGDTVATIRDFRYVDYIAELARFRPR